MYQTISCLSLLLSLVSSNPVHTLKLTWCISLFLCSKKHVTVVSTLLLLNCSHVGDDHEISQDSYHWINWHSGDRPECHGKSRIREACKIKHSMFQHVRWLLSFCKNLFRLTPLFSSTELLSTQCTNVNTIPSSPSELVLQQLCYHNHWKVLFELFCQIKHPDIVTICNQLPKLNICRLKHSGMAIITLIK